MRKIEQADAERNEDQNLIDWSIADFKFSIQEFSLILDYFGHHLLNF